MAPIIAFLPLIAAGIGAATAGVELTHQPGAPKPPTITGIESNAAKSEQSAAVAQANALAKRRGMASTELTSPLATSQGTSTTLGT